MSLNPIITLDHVIDEYRDHLRSEFRARDRALRQALETELERPLFLAQRNEAPVLDEEDRIAAHNLVAFYPQWNGEVFERWSVGPGWQLQLSRHEEVRWLNEGLEPTDAERERGLLLHDKARGFCLCNLCGRQLGLSCHRTTLPA